MFSFSQFDFIYAVFVRTDKRGASRRRHFSDDTHAKTGENRKKNNAKSKMLHTHCFKFSKDIFSAIGKRLFMIYSCGFR